MRRIVILISGRGSNMQALLEANVAQVDAVISNEPDAAGLSVAAGLGVKTTAVHHLAFASRSAFDAGLGDAIAAHRPDLIVLAGFMRILTPEFLARFQDKVINIHPSLLPAFTGIHTHRRALEAGVKIHGCTVHWVTPGLDSGPIIVQAAVPVLPGDTEDSLAARVLREEHRVLPQAVRWVLSGRTSVRGNQVLIAGDCRYPDPITSPLIA